jgi:hypothetical protein
MTGTLNPNWRMDSTTAATAASGIWRGLPSYSFTASRLSISICILGSFGCQRLAAGVAGIGPPPSRSHVVTRRPQWRHSLRRTMRPPWYGRV